MHLRSASTLLVLVAVSCASAPKTTAPQLDRVPPVVVEAACARLRSEGIGSDATLHVVRTTQPLVNASSLRSLAHLYGRDVDASGMAQVFTAALPSTPIDLSHAQACAWKPIDKIDPVRDAQLTIVEFSAPFANPFTRGESGVMVRMSIGGHDAQWYWVPLAERNGQLGVGLVLPMDFHDA